MKLIAAMLLLIAPAAAAQHAPISVNECVRSIKPSELKRVAVFLQATPSDSASKVILPGADLFTQTAAIRIRELLGGSDSKLPAGDSAVSWYSLFGELDVTVKPDGSFTWRTAEWGASADSIERSSLVLLSRVLSDLKGMNESVQWPDGVKRDSIVFNMSLITPGITKDRVVVPVTARQPIPAFTIGMPWESPVDYKDGPHIKYPSNARSIGAIGGVRLEFVVKADGKVDMKSVKEKWQPNERRPTPDERELYVQFLQAVKDGLRSATYKPAVIGGCAVDRLVQQFFSFVLDRS